MPEVIELQAPWQPQVDAQLRAHQHSRYQTDISLTDSDCLHGLIVEPHVMRPEVMSSSQLARHLAQRQIDVRHKTVLDMGCGCGIQGIVCHRLGARHVVFSDISPWAVANTRENLASLDLDCVHVVQGDLLENIDDVFDIIVFNHPFFPGKPDASIPVSVAMLDPGQLIHRFFDQARTHCRDRVIMPFFHLAGDVNDPGVQGPRHGFRVVHHYQQDVCTGLQLGTFSFYDLQWS